MTNEAPHRTWQQLTLWSNHDDESAESFGAKFNEAAVSAEHNPPGQPFRHAASPVQTDQNHNNPTGSLWIQLLLVAGSTGNAGVALQ